MEKEALVKILEQQLRIVKTQRQAIACNPGLVAARSALKKYQSMRLAQTHADFLAQANTRAAALFFLNELYGVQDASARDVDLERIIPTLQRILPVHALQTITQAIMLDALSEQLDTAMATCLGSEFNEQQYANAYRTLTSRDERDRQLMLVKALGASLSELVRIPLLSAMLTLMRGPARAAGLGHLQQFLEHGFGSFKQLKKPTEFVATIILREHAIMKNIFDGNSGIPASKEAAK
jgi:hypothetical protein